MRILHVSDCYLPRLGGIELHLRDLVRHQRAAGHHVSVVTRTPAGRVGDEAEATGDQRGDHALRVRSLTRRDLEDLAPDVVHAHLSVASPLALTVAGRAVALGLPTVATVHSMWTDVARVAPAVRGTLGLHRWPVVWTAVSGRAASAVRAVVEQPVEVIPNAVDTDFWQAVPSSAAAHRARGDVPTVLSVMRLTAVKRALPLARILHQVAATADLDAVIVGDGPKRHALEGYLRRHGLDDRVRVLGALDRAAVREEMRSASVFLAPAYRESFGIAALEARAAGLPVVARADSGVASFIEHGREGLLGHDDRELALHTAALVRDHALRLRIAGHNRWTPPPHTWPAALATNHEAYLLAGATAAAARAGSLVLEPAAG